MRARFISGISWLVVALGSAACGENPEPAHPVPPSPPPPSAPPPTVASTPPPPAAPAPAPASAATASVDKLLKVGTKGTPEANFGTNGAASLPIRPSLVSADGKGGYYVFDQRSKGANDTRIVAIHLAPNGAPDASFGTNGEQELGAPGTSLLQGVTLDGKGRVVLLVSQKAATATKPTIIAYRFANGQLDKSFNGGGASTVTVPTPAVTSPAGPIAIAADSAGRVVIAGTDDPASHRQVWVVRLTENGAIDPSLAKGVAINSSANLGFDVARVAVDSVSGSVVVAANKSVAGGLVAAGEPVPASGGITLFRFDANGMVDAKFGKQGAATLDDQSLAVLDVSSTNGVVVAGGYAGAAAATLKPVILRWTANGSPDSGFGTGGKLVFAGVEGATLGRIRRVTKDGTGRIVAIGGYRTSQDTPVTFVTRLDVAGKLDATFGTNGTASFNVQTPEPEIDPQGNALFRAP